MVTTSYRTCPLCEATCGLELLTDGRSVVRIRGDRDDVFSRGFLCPKGPALRELEADPDRIRTPLVRQGATWRSVTWEEAWREVERGLAPILERHGPDAVAVYAGNPTGHSLSYAFYMRSLIKALKTRNVYTAGSLDQRPKEVACTLLYGHPGIIAVPDIERTRHLLVLGANPMVSNGSLMTAPGVPRRLRAIRERGGTLVVVDPRRTATAEQADEHLAIRPGTDALFLFALVHTILAGGAGRDLSPLMVSGLDRLEELASGFGPDRVASTCGLKPDDIRRTAHRLGDAVSAACYGRVGTCTQEFGTLTSWLVDVVNIVSGNFDRPGGAMFPRPAVELYPPDAGEAPPIRFGRWRSRVRGFPEILGELPTPCLAEEIETSGPEQVRGLITLAGNPALSSPGGGRLAQALASLDFMVSVDAYVNETTQHAHVILPAPSLLTQSHYDVFMYRFAVRNVAHYSPPVFPAQPGEVPEWQILLRLAAIAGGRDTPTDVAAGDEAVIAATVSRWVDAPASPVAGQDPAPLVALLGERRGPDRILDFLLRVGPYGDHFGAVTGGLTLDALVASPHGVDLGPLEPRLPGILRTRTRTIELAPEPLVDDVPRLLGSMGRARPRFVLVGRRDLRSNNSWMHNLAGLSRRARCTVQLHPDDAAELGLVSGSTVALRARSEEIELEAEVTATVPPGVVSVPHGWGHGDRNARQRVAATRPSANINRLVVDDLEPLSGTAVFNGRAVELHREKCHSDQKIMS